MSGWICDTYKPSLKVQNYIHTLFVYQFGVSFNVSITLRKCLQTNISKYVLFRDWLEMRILQNDIPKHKTTLFESNSELEEYRRWYCGTDDSLNSQPISRHLSLSLSFSMNRHDFVLSITGKYHYYEIEGIWGQFSAFQEMRERQLLDDRSWETNILSESECYYKLCNLFDFMTLTNKIPFESANVK